MRRTLLVRYVAPLALVAGVLSVPVQASAGETPVTIQMSRVATAVDYQANDFNLYNCKGNRPWEDLDLRTYWAVNDPATAEFNHSQYFVYKASGQFAVSIGSRFLGSVAFSARSGLSPHDGAGWEPGSLRIPLAVRVSKADLCALRAKGLGGPNVNYRFTVQSVQATVRVEHYNDTWIQDDYDVTTEVQGRPALAIKIPQASAMTKVKIRRHGKKYTFSSRLKVQNSRGAMVNGPSGIKIGFQELDHGAAPYGFGQNNKTRSGGRVKLAKTIIHKPHKWKSYIGTWTNTRSSSKIAWFSSVQADATRIRW